MGKSSEEEFCEKRIDLERASRCWLICPIPLLTLSLLSLTPRQPCPASEQFFVCFSPNLPWHNNSWTNPPSSEKERKREREKERKRGKREREKERKREREKERKREREKERKREREKREKERTRTRTWVALV